MTELVPERARFQAPEKSARALFARMRSWLVAVPGIARLTRAFVAIVANLRSEPITLRAAALTYLTVLSIVPLLAVVFSVFQAIVGQQELQAHLREFLLANLAVGAQETASRYISTYVQRASGIGGIGFAFLLVSSVSLMTNIESALNHIFKAQKPRPLVYRFGIYWCLLTVGPILLALSLAATALLHSSHWIGGPLRRVAFLGPLGITYAAFTLLYLIVPNVRVRVQAALIGAFAGGTAWEIAKVAYAATAARTVRTNAIYGSISAVPVFLVWLYVSWILVLFGAQVAHAVQTSRATDAMRRVVTPIEREILVARVMRAIAAVFAAGQPPPDVSAIAGTLHAFGSDVEEALASLREARLIRGADEGWVPARSLDRITLAEIRSAARQASVPQTGGEAIDLVQRWTRAEAAAERELSMTLDDLVRNSTLPP